MKVCNENLVKDEYYLLIACSTYKVIHEKYDDLLDEHDNVVHTQMSSKKGNHISACISFT